MTSSNTIPKLNSSPCNIPVAVIDTMFTGWEECGKYLNKDKSKKTGKAKNTNPVARMLDTWILLKSITTSGCIHSYSNQLPEVAAFCKIKKRTLQYRIAWLKEHNLLHTHSKNLYLHSYKAMEEEFGIDTSERLKQTINYEPTDNRSLAEMLWPVGLSRLRKRCIYMYNKKIDESPGLRGDIEDHAISYENHKINQQKLHNDSEYFRQSHEVLQVKSYKHKAYQQTFNIAHNASDANPGIDLTQATLAKHCGYSIKQKKDENGKDISVSSGMGHHLRRLEDKEIITMTPQHVVSEYVARKDEKIFQHKYVHKKKQTIWYRPNHIKIHFDQISLEKKTA